MPVGFFFARPRAVPDRAGVPRRGRASRPMQPAAFAGACLVAGFSVCGEATADDHTPAPPHPAPPNGAGRMAPATAVRAVRRGAKPP